MVFRLRETTVDIDNIISFNVSLVHMRIAISVVYNRYPRLQGYGVRASEKAVTFLNGGALSFIARQGHGESDVGTGFRPKMKTAVSDKGFAQVLSDQGIGLGGEGMILDGLYKDTGKGQVSGQTELIVGTPSQDHNAQCRRQTEILRPG